MTTSRSGGSPRLVGPHESDASPGRCRAPRAWRSGAGRAVDRLSASSARASQATARSEFECPGAMRRALRRSFGASALPPSSSRRRARGDRETDYRDPSREGSERCSLPSRPSVARVSGPGSEPSTTRHRPPHAERNRPAGVGLPLGADALALDGDAATDAPAPRVDCQLEVVLSS